MSARPPSPFELLHPDGLVRSSAVLGGGCPETLAAALPGHAGPLDLAVLAPGTEEAGDPAWLRGAARELADALAPDGLAVVLAPPARRAAAARALERAGLVRAGTFLRAGRHLVSADSRALRHALGTVLAPSSRRRLAHAVAPMPGGARALAAIAGGTPVLRPVGARPLLAWTRGLAPGADPDSAVLTETWREHGGSSLVHVFGPTGAAPFAVAKVRAADAEAAHARELAALETVAPGARVAGVETPELIASSRVGGRPALLASAVPGRPASLLPNRPGALDRLAAWLEAWGRATVVPDGLSAAEVEERLAAGVRALAPHLPGADAYEASLRRLAAPLPAVAAHNDLTTANVLLAGDRLGIVDWESAAARDLPLRDLVYATVDVHLATGRFPSRPAAFEACYLRNGVEADAARRHLARARAALGLTREAVLACFHACWLEHAANDLRRIPAGESEFVAVAALAARERQRLAATL